MMFSNLLLKNEKNVICVFRNEGPGFWIKKTILAITL